MCDIGLRRYKLPALTKVLAAPDQRERLLARLRPGNPGLIKIFHDFSFSFGEGEVKISFVYASCL